MFHRDARGASGDAPDYEAIREFEDVAAVIDAVLDGQQHIAHRLVPEAFTEHVVTFLRPVP